MKEIWNQMNWPNYLLERFWKKVKPPKNKDDCWIWNGCLSNHGYGSFNNTVLGKMIRSHRFSYECYNGPIPDGMLVCHKCDIPSCCNPNHLWIGTPQQNNLDKMIKNRHSSKYGSECNLSILSEIDIIDIIERINNNELLSIQQICYEYNISTGAIYDIFKRKSWKHITNDISNDELKLLKEKIAGRCRSKLSKEDVLKIRELLLKHNYNSIANMFNVTNRTISLIDKNITHKNSKNEDIV